MPLTLPPPPPRDGLPWVLTALLIAAIIAACQASSPPGESVEYDIPPLPTCPEPVCPPPVCPERPDDTAVVAAKTAPDAHAPPAETPPHGSEPAQPAPSTPARPNTPAPPPEASAAPTAPAPGASDRVNINTADAAGLRRLPGVGPKMAARIIETRAKRPFRRPRDLMRVKGIGRATFAKLKERIAVR